MKDIMNFKRRAWFVPFIFLAGVLLASPFAKAQAPVPELKPALRFIELDQTKKAIAELNKAVAAHPEDASLLYYLGYAQIKGGQPEEALKSFEKGIAKNEKEPLNYVGKGHLQMLNNNLTEAKRFFDQALTMTKSKNPAVLKAVAEAYLTNPKNVADALPLLQKAKGINEQDAETHILLGDAYLAQNNGGSAVSSYERAAKLDPKSALAHYKIGLVYLRSKNLGVAQDAFTKAITTDPDYTLAHKEQGELYYLRKEGSNAVKAYENYLRLTDKPEEGKLRYAFFLFMAKDYAKANVEFEKLAQKPDVSPVTLRYYAYSLFESGDIAKSQTVFEQYFSKAKPEEVDAGDHAYYGKLLIKLGKDSLAVLSFQNSLNLEPNQPEILQSQGEILFKTKKYNEAAEAYNKLLAIRTKPLSADYYTLGRSYYYSEQYDKADTVFQKLAEMQPNMTIGYLWQARSKANLDPESENGLAKPYYEKVIEKASANPEKGKNDLIEAYRYLGYYYVLKNDVALSKSYWEKVLALNPNDEQAKEALKSIATAQNPRPPSPKR